MTIKRITFMQELLAFLGLEGRVHLEWISSSEAQKFVQVVTDFTEKIRSLGPNPLVQYTETIKATDPETIPVSGTYQMPQPQKIYHTARSEPQHGKPI
jgi:F420-non-reducing hydrogenase iron-sulfur subunit